MLGTLGAGWLGDRVGRRKVLLFGAIVGPASLLVFTALDGWDPVPCFWAGWCRHGLDASGVYGDGSGDLP